MSLHSLPVFVRLAGRPVILLGDGAPAEAKRRLLERAGAVIVGEEAPAALAIVAIEDEAEALAAVARLKARGLLVNAVDRAALCDFTIPAIVERGPVLVSIGTGGVSAGLAAALRQRIEALFPQDLGMLAQALHAARARLRTAFPDVGQRRRVLGAALAPGGLLDPLVAGGADRIDAVFAGALPTASTVTIALRSADPEDLTLREARWLALADRIVHAPDTPPAILDRARADAERIVGAVPGVAAGLTVIVENMA
jgi:uroporphyrin-III C-methyltransferase/precorrin-2 dehydrogenase/sirohydrochlorin ferrochelatase